jgi:hypothetical protein
MTTQQSGTKPKRVLRKQPRTSSEPESRSRAGGLARHAAPKQVADVGTYPVQGQPIWISVAVAADRAGVNPRTIKRWISNTWLSATRLPSRKGMGQLRVRLGDVDALIARGALS